MNSPTLFGQTKLLQRKISSLIVIAFLGSLIVAPSAHAVATISLTSANRNFGLIDSPADLATFPDNDKLVITGANIPANVTVSFVSDGWFSSPATVDLVTSTSISVTMNVAEMRIHHFGNPLKWDIVVTQVDNLVNTATLTGAYTTASSLLPKNATVGTVLTPIRAANPISPDFSSWFWSLNCLTIDGGNGASFIPGWSSGSDPKSYTVQPSDLGKCLGVWTGGGVIAGWSTVVGPISTTVPDLTGLTKSAAEAAITAAGLTIGTETPMGIGANYSNNFKVISASQSPVASTATINPAQTVSFTYYQAPTLTVPDLTGLTKSAAEAAITAAGLTIGTQTPTDLDAVFANNFKVVASTQSPDALVTTFNPADTVSFTYYQAPTLTVPSLTGLTKSAAENAITNAGLTVGTETPTGIGATYANNLKVVTSTQNPTATTTTFNPADTVSFTYYVAPTLTVPNLTGLTKFAAEAAITGAGLTVGTETAITDGSTPDNLYKVISSTQAPGSGATTINPADTVSFSYYAPAISLTSINRPVGLIENPLNSSIFPNNDKLVITGAHFPNNVTVSLVADGWFTSLATVNSSTSTSISITLNLAEMKLHFSGNPISWNIVVNNADHVANTATLVDVYMTASSMLPTNASVGTVLIPLRAPNSDERYYYSWQYALSCRAIGGLGGTYIDGWSSGGSDSSTFTVRVADIGKCIGVWTGLGANAGWSTVVGPITAVVPDLTGLTKSEAEAAIVNAGLTVGTESPTNIDATYINNLKVVSATQSPVASTTTINPTDAVSFTYYQAPTLTVPDLTGLTKSEAEAAIVDAGLTVGTLTPVTDGSTLENLSKVITSSQIPEVNATTFNPADTVSFSYYAPAISLTSINRSVGLIENPLVDSLLPDNDKLVITGENFPTNVEVVLEAAGWFFSATTVDSSSATSISITLNLAEIRSWFNGNPIEFNIVVRNSDHPANSSTLVGAYTIASSILPMNASVGAVLTPLRAPNSDPRVYFSWQYSTGCLAVGGLGGTYIPDWSTGLDPEIYTVQVRDIGKCIGIWTGLGANAGWSTVVGPITAVIPDLSGLSITEAEAAIHAAGLTVGIETPTAVGATFSNHLKVSTTQAPAALSTTINPAATISFSYYVAPTFTVPDLTGLTKLEAEAAITSAGLMVGTATAITAGSTSENNLKVISATQSPVSATTTINPADSVSFSYYSYSPPPAPPAPVYVAPFVPVATETSPATATVTAAAGGTLNAQIPGATSAATQTVSIVIPANSVTESVVFSLAPVINGADTTPGYSVIKLTAAATTGGAAVTKFAQPVAITIPAGATGSAPAWSVDGFSWTTMTKLTSAALPDGLADGFFINSDGSYLLLTRHLTQFGFRKAQTVLSVKSVDAVVQLTKSTQLSTEGGSGIGAVEYLTTTPGICSISATGLMTAIAAGDCSVSVHKLASTIYLDVTASASVKVSDSDAVAAAALVVKAAEEAAAAQAAAEAAKIIRTSINKAKTLVVKSSDANGTSIALNFARNYAGKTVKVEIYTKANGKTVERVIATLKLNSQGDKTYTSKSLKIAGATIKVKYGSKYIGAVALGK